MRTLLLLLCLAQDSIDDREKNTLLQLEKTKLSFSLSDLSLKDASAVVCKLTGLEIAIDEAVEDETRHTMDVTDKPLAQVLDELCAPAKLAWLQLDGQILITTKKGREALTGGPRTEDLKKDKVLWDKLRAKASIAAESKLGDALKMLGDAAGVKIACTAAPDQKLAATPELSVLGCLRLVAWQKGLTLEIQDSRVTLKK